MTRIAVGLFGLVLCLAWGCAPRGGGAWSKRDALARSSAGEDARTTMLVLVGGTVYVGPADEPLHDGVVIIRDGRIAAVGRRDAVRIPGRARTLDCAGLTVTAGFWNSHVHFLERKWADAATIPAPELGQQLEDAFMRYGFTSVFDLSSAWENTRAIRDRIESGEVSGPAVRSTGEGLIPPDALPPALVIRMMGFVPTPLPEIADVAEAATVTQGLIGDGVDGIKLFLSSQRGDPLPDGSIEAAVDAARRAGKPVFAHPNTTEDVLAAVRGGVDVIAHTTPRSGPWDQMVRDAVLAATKDRAVAITPTLALWQQTMRHDRLSERTKLVETAIGQLRVWIDAGGAVLFGTDLGAVEYDPRPEYALMARAGMSFREILASLTTAPAERFGTSDQRGRILAGARADLVVLGGDPALDIRALADVRYTLRSGRVIHRAGE